MSLDAYNKLTNTVFNKLSNYNLESKKEINDLTELDKIMKTALKKGFNIAFVKAIYHFVTASATEYIYSNGLILLDSKIIFKDKTVGEGLHIIRQLTLTSDYKEKSLVNIIIENEKLALQQLLTTSNSNNLIIPIEDRTINFLKTVVYVNEHCGSVFETFTDTNNDCLLVEKYKQYYPISEYEDSPKDLLRLCGFGNRYLEIIYHHNQPVFAQFDDQYKVEMAGYAPNCPVDVKCIIEKINEELSNIITAINSILNRYESKENRAKKLLKK